MRSIPLSHRLLLSIATGISVLMVVAACAADDPLPVEPAQDKPSPQVDRPQDLVDLTGRSKVEVEVGDNYFSPRNFIVDPGTEIVFLNVGFSPHNVIPATEGAFERIPDTALAAGPVSLILDEPGDFPLFCSIHGTATFGQTAYVVVADS